MMESGYHVLCKQDFRSQALLNSDNRSVDIPNSGESKEVEMEISKEEETEISEEEEMEISEEDETATNGDNSQ